MKPFITAAEQTFPELFWIGQNQNQYSDARLKTLSKDLILIYDENNLIRCKGRLKHATLPYDTKTPYMLNSEYYLSELIVKNLHAKLKHISIKQTLTELKQKVWLCQGRNFVRKVLKNCFLCKKYEGPPFQCPITTPLTKFCLTVMHFTQPESIILTRSM